MNKPTPEELLSFFRSDIFQTAQVQSGDFSLAIEAFYKRFYSAFDQSKYNEIGIHIDEIRREQLVFDEQTDTDFKVTIDFHFIQEPQNKQSFSLIGTEEEKMFYDQNKEELLSFLILKFRRYSRLFIQ